MIEEGHADLSVRKQCELLQVRRSSFYYQPVTLKEETELANEINELWQEMPFYGYRRITAELRRRGFVVNGKRVIRLMHEMHIEALYPKPKTTIRAREDKVYPYLLKDLSINAPSIVWATDITYIRLPGGFVYLVALIDVYSRRVLTWRLSNTMDTYFCLEMLKEALEIYGIPLIINTDQGCQFTSQAWIMLVESHGIRVSMDGKGRWADNITIERFWRSLKHEHLALYALSTIAEVRRSIGGYVTLYNHKRLHQSLGYKTPAEVYGVVHKTGDTHATPQFAKPAGYVDNAARYPHAHMPHNNNFVSI